MKTVQLNQATRRRLQKVLWDLSSDFYVFPCRERGYSSVNPSVNQRIASFFTASEHDMRMKIDSAPKGLLLKFAHMAVWSFLVDDCAMPADRIRLANTFFRYGIVIPGVDELCSDIFTPEGRLALDREWMFFV